MAEETTITEDGSSPSVKVATGPIFANALEPATSQTDTGEKPPAKEPEVKDPNSLYEQHPELKKRIDKVTERERKAEELIRSLESVKSGHEQTTKQLMDKIAALEGKLTPKQEEKVDYKPIQNMTREQVRDWLDSDEIGFFSNLLKQLHHESASRLPKFDEEALVNNVLKRLTGLGEQAKAKQTAAEQKAEIEKFAKDHPDMEEMVPQIVEFRNKQPWRDPISIYWELKGSGPDVKKQIDEAVEAAKKEWEKEHIKEGAKQTHTPIKSGNAPRSSPNEIKQRPGESEDAFIYRLAQSKIKKAA